MVSALSLVWHVSAGQAREVMVTGGLSTGYDYFDRQQKGTTPADTVTGSETAALATTTNTNQADFQKIIIRPLVSLQAVSERDNLLLRYEPGFYYDHLNDEQDLDQKGSFAARRLLTKDWQLFLSDSYQKRDDANRADTVINSQATADVQQQGTGGNSGTVSSLDQLTNAQARRKYAINNALVRSEYTYLQGSVFALGYNLDTLRNDNNTGLNNQDFDKHDAYLSLAHRLSETGKISLTGHYIRGLFDTPGTGNSQDSAAAATADSTVNPNDLSDDVTEYQTGLGLESSRIPHQPLSLDYNRAAYDYDSDLRDDSEIHNLTLGWQWQYSPHLTFNAGAGPSYVMTDNQDDTWGYNGNLGVNRKLERGSLGLFVNKGLERQNFTGNTIDNGLIDFWDSRADFSYQLLASTTVSLFTGYRYEDNDTVVASNTLSSQVDASALQTDATQTGKITTKRFSTGCSAKYSFWQWYAVNLSYSYANQVSDTPVNEYDEHRAMLTLSYEKEFFQW